MDLAVERGTEKPLVQFQDGVEIRDDVTFESLE
jgi:hypothetical protein